MSAPKLYTCFDRPPDSFEINEGEELVEKVGYVPANVLIENMIYAGQRLDLARSAYYDFPEGKEVDDDFLDPTRKPGFDLADASSLMRTASGRLAEQRKLFEKEEAERRRAEEEEKKQFKLFQEEQKKKKEDVKKEEK